MIYLLRGQHAGLDYTRAFSAYPTPEAIASFSAKQGGGWVLVQEIPIVPPDTLATENEMAFGMQGVGNVVDPQ